MAHFRSDSERTAASMAVNEVKEQSVGEKTGGAEPAVSDRMVSTFCSRKTEEI